MYFLGGPDDDCMAERGGADGTYGDGGEAPGLSALEKAFVAGEVFLLLGLYEEDEFVLFLFLFRPKKDILL